VRNVRAGARNVKRVRFVRQAEARECGLAALAMVAGAYGKPVGLRTLRQRFPAGSRGTSLAQMVGIAAELGLAGRAVSVQAADLDQLALPCVLHWDLNHFVVLERVTAVGAVIQDPAVGERRLAWIEIDLHFSGVALELAPDASFIRTGAARQPGLRQMLDPVAGMKAAILRILLVAVALEALALTMPMMGKFIVDDVIATGRTALLDVIAAAFLALLTLQTLLSFARSRMVLWLGDRVALQWKRQMFAHLLRLPMRYFELRHLGDVVSRFGAVDEIRRILTQSALEAILDGLLALAALALMLYYSVLLTSVVVGAVLVYALLRWALHGPLRKASEEGLSFNGKETSCFVETVRAITPLKLFGREEGRLARWTGLATEVQHRRVRVGRLNISMATCSMFVFGLETIVVYWLSARMIVADPKLFSVGMLFAFTAYKLQFVARVTRFIDHAADFLMLALHAERLSDIALEPVEAHAVDGKIDSAIDAAGLAPTLELRGVCYRYSASEPWILEQIDMTVTAGELLAITGSSGSGKTTLLKIVLGLVPPTQGQVLYGGIPIAALGMQRYRALIGAVMQDDAMLTGTIAENIAFFDAAIDLARVEACAARARIAGEIAALPMGYHTVVGELGSGLSGGQKQRLLLARALYKQPRMLVLDEATSHLDVVNEQAITHELSAMSLTRIVVAHRPTTIDSADRVLHLERGRMTESTARTSAGRAREAVAMTP
jgi:ATP-binding cassette subfamily B protein RaxB